jgi:hypothetical protein
MSFPSITNRGEFFSNHYLDAIIAGDLAGVNRPSWIEIKGKGDTRSSLQFTNVPSVVSQKNVFEFDRKHPEEQIAKIILAVMTQLARKGVVKGSQVTDARRASNSGWKMQDPQLPKSIWYHTDAQFLGFRVIRPLKVPPPEELSKYWNSGVERD